MTFRQKSELELQKKKAIDAAEARKLQEEIRVINEKYRNPRRVSTTKILMAFILINCTVVEIYSMWLMVYLQNLDPLTTLMGSVITESISFAIYCVKSFKETKEEGLLALDRDRWEATQATGNFVEEASDDDDDDYRESVG